MDNNSRIMKELKELKEAAKNVRKPFEFKSWTY